MGGQGGAVVKNAPSSDYLKNPEDYYSSTSCVNCHNPLPENHSIAPEIFELKPSPCTAEMQWPKHLQTPIRNIERYPWWIHQNFLYTRMQKDAVPVIPRKLDLGLTLFMKSGAKVPLSDDLELRARENASISFKPIPSGQGQDFSLLLENQTLFQTENVSAHVPKWYDLIIPTNLIQTLAIRDGHPIVTAAVGALNLFRSRSNPLFSEFDILNDVLPQVPVAYHTQSGKTVNWKEFKNLSIPEARKYHRIEVLFETARSGRIPGRLRLDDLYHLARDFQESARLSKESGTPPADFSKFSALISSIRLTVGLIPDEINHPGLFMKFKEAADANLVQVDLETEGVTGIKSLKAEGALKMEEIFLPGLANLGPSDLDFKFTADASGATSLSLSRIQSSIKPIDLLKSDPRKLGLIQIKEGTIQDGSPAQWEGIQFPPGIHINTSATGEMGLTLNLNVDLSVSLPLLGEVRIKGPLLFKSALQKFEEEKKGPDGQVLKETRYDLVPESTVLILNGSEFSWGHSLAPFKVEGDLILTDLPSGKRPSLLTASKEGFWGNFKATRIAYGVFQSGSFELNLPISRGPNALYALDQFANLPVFSASLKILEKDKTQIVGNTDLKTEIKGSEKNYRLNISLEHRDETGTKVIDPLIDQGLVTLLKNSASGFPRYDLDFGAQSMWLDPYGVTAPKVHFAFTDNPMESVGFDWTVHSLDLSGNPWSLKRPNRGILQGPFLLKILPSRDKEKEFRVRYDSPSDRLDLKNLKMAVDFKQLVPPGLKEISSGKISSIDVDGHLYGHWSMDTETYKGKGYLAFQGDKEGDFHLRTLSGRRVEGILNPDDPDRLYEIPFIADSSLTLERMDGIDFNRKRVLAPAVFTPLFDWLALQAFGIRWNQHDRARIKLDYIPYTVEGLVEYFQNRAQSTQPGPPKGLQP